MLRLGNHEFVTMDAEGFDDTASASVRSRAVRR
jgi:hypothetical protein